MTFEQIFSGVVQIPSSELKDELSQANLASWSSLAHISLITALEEHYGVSFSTQEILAAKSLGTLRGLLRTKGAAL